MHGVEYKLVEIRNRFREYYNTELRHKYAELEPIRRKYLWQFFCGVLLFVIGLCLFILFALETKKDYVRNLFLVGCIFYLFFTGAICLYPISAYKKVSKKLVWGKIMKFWSKFEINEQNSLKNTLEMLNNSRLFGEISERKFDDDICGVYDGLPIEVTEQKIISKVKSADVPSYLVTFFFGGIFDWIITFFGERREVESSKMLFSGLLIHIKFFKKIFGEVVVFEKIGISSYFENNWLSFLKIILSFMIFIICALFFYVLNKVDYSSWSLLGIVSCGGKYILLFVALFSFYYFCVYSVNWWKMSSTYHDMMDTVGLEDVEFSKNWEVRAEDQVEARYVLTPALMERMLAVKRLFHGNRLDFSFWDNNLLIAVHTNKDMFETTSLFKSALDYRKVQEVICQLYSVFSVIDVLKIQNDSKKA